MSMKKHPGFSLLEVMVAALILALTATAFAALYPQAHQLRSRAENMTRATMLAQHKIEQLRNLAFTDLNYEALRVANVIDASPTSSPYTFTEIDSLTNDLPQGSGTLTIVEQEENLVRVDVTVSWDGAVSSATSVTTSTYIANKEGTEASSS
jgi:prepilin-type N-terminal cleavage/methylation domain-containing protein